MVEILYKSKTAIAIIKPAGVLSEGGSDGENIAASLAEQLRALGEPDELLAVHRLDRAVGGVMVFARDKESARLLSEQFSGRETAKKYLAVVEGEAECEAELSDYLYRDSALLKAFVCDKRRIGAKACRLSYKRLAMTDTPYSLLLVTLGTGRFHQIRAQLSSRGLPIVGDGKYGAKNRRSGVALFSTSLTFNDGKKEVTVSAKPDKTQFPWSEFCVD